MIASYHVFREMQGVLRGIFQWEQLFYICYKCSGEMVIVFV